MSQEKQLRQLERKAYLSYQQDGILDLLIGWATLAFGLSMVIDSSIWTFMAWLPIIFYVPLKNRITVPRLGYVKFDASRGGLSKWSISVLIVGFLALMTMGLAVFLLGDWSPIAWIRDNALLFYGLVGLVGFAIGGLISGIPRLYLYALLSLVLMSGGQLLGVEQYLPFLLLGGAILVTGALLMARFMRSFPVSSEDV
jgi:hypothetical protein